jgi:ribosomal protein L16 Arg81 hydroxylase
VPSRAAIVELVSARGNVHVDGSERLQARIAGPAAPGDSTRIISKPKPVVTGRIKSLTLEWGPFSRSRLARLLQVENDPVQTDGASRPGTRTRRGGRGAAARARILDSEQDAGRSNAVTPQTLIVNDLDRHIPALADYVDDEFFPAILGLERASEANRTGSDAQPRRTSEEVGSAAQRPRGTFLPRWRRDDAQLSVSSRGGGIGPHVDSYDVFLVQIQGDKQWTVSEAPLAYHEELDRTIPNLDVRVLDLRTSGRPTTGAAAVKLHEPVVVRPGDVLYVPPRFVHDGVALADDCQTLSVGCRAPSAWELLSRTTEHLATLPTAGAGASGRAILEASEARYTDDIHDDHEPVTITSNVRDRMKDLLRNAVERALEDDVLWDELVGRLVTESLRGRDSDVLPSSWPSPSAIPPPNFVSHRRETAWQRRPGVSIATSHPSPDRVRLFCQGEMWEACLATTEPSSVTTQQQLQSLLSLLKQVETGQMIAAETVDRAFLSLPPAAAEMWSRLVNDGVIISIVR